jgi:hypothetical protein
VAAHRHLTARFLQCENPDWRPLERIMDVELVGWFMWMHEAATPSGRPIHAYKHIATRCYVHLDLDGNAYTYVHEDRYRPIDLAELLELALRPWWEEGLGAEVEEVAASWRAIARARRAAAAARGR